MIYNAALAALPWVLMSSALLLSACNCGEDAARPPGACELRLLPGDLVITEISADPPGADSGREWFEIYNGGADELDLRGVLLLHSREDGTDAKIHEIGRSWVVSPDTYVVAGSLLDEDNVLAVVPYVDYGYGSDLGDMRNSAGRLAIACGDDLIDEATYLDPTEGASRGFTGGRTPDAGGNDDLNLWCDATTEIDTEAMGTPGEPNDICFGTGGPVSCVEDGTLREARPPAAGDLVITEVMSDPSMVDDNDGEWIEVYVGADIDLNGVAVGEAEDRSDAIPVVGNDCVPVAAGTRLVFARDDDPAQNGGLPPVDGIFDFSLNQSNNQVVLSYGLDTLDVLPYGSSTAGTALNLDPDFENPDDNDDPRYLCRATTPYGDGDLGTPGEPNIECDIPAPEGQCLDGDTFREIVPPQPGDLVINELMANPEAADEESDSEWFEIRASADFDLNGLSLGTVEGEPRDTIEVSSCLRLSAGEFALVAREEDPTLNGGLPQVDATFGFALTNSNGSLWVGTDTVTFDFVAWPSVSAGAARSLDPAAADPTSNDDDALWCPAIDPYGDGDLGTPGADNPACGGIPTGTCNDGGMERDLVPPEPGDLVITEFMPNPAAVDDGVGEWVEILANAPVDLNGLQFGSDPKNLGNGTAVGGDCLSVVAGGRMVFARHGDPLVNGGLVDAVAATFLLTNGSSALHVGMADEVLDSVTWTSTSAGVALTLDPTAEDTLSNDDEANFCDAIDVYGDGDLGTPGTQGPSCGGGMGDGMCDDGGMPRAVVVPQLGDLVITEVMPNPSAVDDNMGEWFEVLVTADVDLNGLQFGDDPMSPDATLPGGGSCIAVVTGDRLVFARNADTMANGGLPAVTATFSFGLVNGSDALFVGVDGALLDEITWSSSNVGASWSLDPASEDTVANDDEANFCAGSAVYGDGDMGSPGAANPSC